MAVAAQGPDPRVGLALAVGALEDARNALARRAHADGVPLVQRLREIRRELTACTPHAFRRHTQLLGVVDGRKLDPNDAKEASVWLWRAQGANAIPAASAALHAIVAAAAARGSGGTGAHTAPPALLLATAYGALHLLSNMQFALHLVVIRTHSPKTRDLVGALCTPALLTDAARAVRGLRSLPNAPNPNVELACCLCLCASWLASCVSVASSIRAETAAAAGEAPGTVLRALVQALEASELLQELCDALARLQPPPWAPSAAAPSWAAFGEATEADVNVVCAVHAVAAAAASLLAAPAVAADPALRRTVVRLLATPQVQRLLRLGLQRVLLDGTPPPTGSGEDRGGDSSSSSSSVRSASAGASGRRGVPGDGAAPEAAAADAPAEVSWFTARQLPLSIVAEPRTAAQLHRTLIAASLGVWARAAELQLYGQHEVGGGGGRSGGGGSASAASSGTSGTGGGGGGAFPCRADALRLCSSTCEALQVLSRGRGAAGLYGEELCKEADDPEDTAVPAAAYAMAAQSAVQLLRLVAVGAPDGDARDASHALQAGAWALRGASNVAAILADNGGKWPGCDDEAIARSTTTVTELLRELERLAPSWASVPAGPLRDACAEGLAAAELTRVLDELLRLRAQQGQQLPVLSCAAALQRSGVLRAVVSAKVHPDGTPVALPSGRFLAWDVGPDLGIMITAAKLSRSVQHGIQQPTSGPLSSMFRVVQVDSATGETGLLALWLAAGLAADVLQPPSGGGSGGASAGGNDKGGAGLAGRQDVRAAALLSAQAALPLAHYLLDWSCDLGNGEVRPVTVQAQRAVLQACRAARAALRVRVTAAAAAAVPGGGGSADAREAEVHQAGATFLSCCCGRYAAWRWLETGPQRRRDKCNAATPGDDAAATLAMAAGLAALVAADEQVAAVLRRGLCDAALSGAPVDNLAAETTMLAEDAPWPRALVALARVLSERLPSGAQAPWARLLQACTLDAAAFAQAAASAVVELDAFQATELGAEALELGLGSGGPIEVAAAALAAVRVCAAPDCRVLAGPHEYMASKGACGRCGGAWYDTRECQARHWKEHRRVCGGAAQAPPAGAAGARRRGGG